VCGTSECTFRQVCQCTPGCWARLWKGCKHCYLAFWHMLPNLPIRGLEGYLKNRHCWSLKAPNHATNFDTLAHNHIAEGNEMEKAQGLCVVCFGHCGWRPDPFRPQEYPLWVKTRPFQTRSIPSQTYLGMHGGSQWCIFGAKWPPVGAPGALRACNHTRPLPASSPPASKQGQQHLPQFLQLQRAKMKRRAANRSQKS